MSILWTTNITIIGNNCIIKTVNKTNK